MENQNGTANPSNGEEFVLPELVLSDDPEELKAQLTAVHGTAKTVIDKNKQLFARAKTAEGKVKPESGTPAPLTPEPKEFDSAALERKIEEKVSLRMKGYDPEHIEEIERYARGAGLNSLLEAEKNPFVQKALAALQAEKKSLDSTPAPSNRVHLVNGKPANDVLRDASASLADKQAALEARMKRA